jgi:hypothetical protein
MKRPFSTGIVVRSASRFTEVFISEPVNSDVTSPDGVYSHANGPRPFWRTRSQKVPCTVASNSTMRLA